MKKGLFFILLTLLIFSCSDKESVIAVPDDIEQEEEEEDCIIQQEVYPPIGYELIEIGEINIGTFDSEFPPRFNSFQFLNDLLGYALVEINGPGSATRVKVYKTLDGGNSWTSLSLNTIDIPLSFEFKDESNGIISFFGASSEEEKCITYITNDGGGSWERKVVENLNGVFLDFIINEEGTIFGHLTPAVTGDKAKVLKSEDFGNTWKIIHDNGNSDIQISNFHQIKNDVIYLTSKDGELIQMNFEGGIVKRIQTPANLVRDFWIFNDDKMLVAYDNKLVRTENGGVSWDTLLNRKTTIIDFESEDEGVILSGGEHCDYYGHPGLFTSTSTAGETWNDHSILTSSIFQMISEFHKASDNSIYFFWGLTEYKQYMIRKE